MQIDYRKLNRPQVVFPAVAVCSLLLLGVFLFPDSHATHRWIRFGNFFTFQPSEIAKPALVLFLAWFLQSRMQSMQDWRNTLIPAAMPSLIFIALIVKEPDLGTAMVCAGVTALMLYLAGMEMKYLGYAALAAAPVLYWLALSRAVASGPHARISQSGSRSAGKRLPHDSVADRGGNWRSQGAGLHGR